MSNYRSFPALLLIGFIVFLSHCTGNSGQPDGKKSATKSRKISAGEIVYRQYCFSCHQLNGEGVKGMYPPLGDTEWVNGDKQILIELILNGQQGEQIIKGEKYTEEMPKADYLTNKEIADVLTYIRSHFGNNSSPITAKEVGMIRLANKKK